jgi:N-acetylmuramoyl-L-alanine amidase-like protein/putative peptidoglycan binding protein
VRLGDHGPQVVAWQQALVARGFALTVDGDFGQRTHNATLAFQSAHGLTCTGVVSASELQVLAAPTTASIRPPPTLPHTIPFVEARHYNRTPRAIVDLIVLHCMEAPEAATQAEQCAAFFATLGPDHVASAHYCVDSDSVVQCVPDHCVAYHAPGANKYGLGIELAGYARQSRLEWLDTFGVRMLWLAAQLTARKCAERNIPVVYLPAAKLLGPRPRGITTHCEVNRAFKKSDHTDPGPGFPIDYFIEHVEVAMDSQAGYS